MIKNNRIGRYYALRSNHLLGKLWNLFQSTCIQLLPDATAKCPKGYVIGPKGIFGRTCRDLFRHGLVTHLVRNERNRYVRRI